MAYRTMGFAKGLLSVMLAAVLAVGFLPICQQQAQAATSEDLSGLTDDETALYYYMVSDYLFTDVMNPSKYWFGAVYAIANEGWMTGKTSTTFGVEDALTRAQMVTVLWRIACPDDYAAYTSSVQKATKNTTGMDDVADGAYYTAAVNWAVENDIVTGKKASDGTYYFDPSGSCTFQQFCTILARYLAGGDSALEAQVSDALASSTLASFSDSGSVSSYARKAIAYCVIEGAVSGKANGTLAPTETVIRGRCVTVFYKALQAGLIG